MYQNGYQFQWFIHSLQRNLKENENSKSPVHNMAETLNIDVRNSEKLKGNLNEYNFLEELDVDLAIVVAYGKFLPENFLPLVKKGFINIHASILPYRRCRTNTKSYY